mgnify:CR=1 FL=1
MEFIDLAAQQRRIRGEIEGRIRKVLDHGQYIMGPEITSLEGELARYVGVKHAIACASGTDALLMALMARGIGPGDAVLTTPFTFIATAEVVSLLGATPVFVDIDPKTYNIDPDHLERCLAAFRDHDAGPDLEHVRESVQKPDFSGVINPGSSYFAQRKASSPMREAPKVSTPRYKWHWPQRLSKSRL